MDAMEITISPTSFSSFCSLLVDWTPNCFWRGVDGKGSRISFSPPEGIRLNHDRWWNVTFKARVLVCDDWRSSSQQFFERRINLIQWEQKFNGVEAQWERGKQRKQRKSRGRKQQSERHQHQPCVFILFICLGNARDEPTKKTWRGQPEARGYRLGVGHICCKCSWNFSIFMLLFCANHRDESRKFEWECWSRNQRVSNDQIALFLVVTRGPSPGSCTEVFEYCTCSFVRLCSTTQ